jgi:hypothetical protein
MRHPVESRGWGRGWRASTRKPGKIQKSGTDMGMGIPVETRNSPTALVLMSIVLIDRTAEPDRLADRRVKWIQSSRRTSDTTHRRAKRGCRSDTVRIR